MSDLSEHLPEQAETLAKLDPGRPRQANLRRSVSAAYYPLFHFLIDQPCRSVLGGAYGRRQIRSVLARAFEHGQMKDASASFGGGTLPKWMHATAPALVVPPDLQRVARAFVSLQEARHSADYDLAAAFTRRDVGRFVAEARDAIARWPNVADDDAARLYLASLLCWRALRQR